MVCACPSEPSTHSTSPTLTWCAIHAWAGRERAVYESLIYRGIETFLPIERLRRVKGGKVQHIDRPLYPGYAFAAYPDSDIRYEIRRSKYVLELLHTTTELAQQRMASDIASLRMALEIDPTADVTEWASEPGRHVRVISGSFVGLTGTIIRRARKVSDKHIVKDLLYVGVMFLGRVLEIEIDPSFCEPC